MAPLPIQNVADTAFGVAHYRAEETDRPDALFKDPLARTLAGEQGREIAQRMPGEEISGGPGGRQPARVSNDGLRGRRASMNHGPVANTKSSAAHTAATCAALHCAGEALGLSG